MIKLSGSRFTDIMPENLAEQPEIQALAYAVGRQVEKLLAYADAPAPMRRSMLCRKRCWICWPWNCVPRPMTKTFPLRSSEP